MRWRRTAGNLPAAAPVLLAVLAIIASASVAAAADPGLDPCRRHPERRRTLLTADDLVITNAIWSSNTSTDQRSAVLFTDDGTVSNAQSYSIKTAQCGVDTGQNGANKAFPLQTRVARLLDRSNDVVVSLFAGPDAYGDGCQGSDNLQIRVYDYAQSQQFPSPSASTRCHT
jgi:hypothetical protein